MKYKTDDINILTWDKRNSKTKTVIRDKERYLTIIKGSTEKDIKIMKLYAPKNRAPKYTKQKLTQLKGRIDGSTTGS